MENHKQPERILHQVVLVHEGNKEVEYTYQAVCEQLGVEGLIRIPAADFTALLVAGESVAHFNLGSTNHQIGKRYALVKIVRNGRYRTNTSDETPPLLSLDEVRVMECTGVENALAPEALTTEYFEHSYAGISDSVTLKDALKRRYGSTRPGGLTEADIGAVGVAYTLLKAV